MHNIIMQIVDNKRFAKAMKDKGYSSIGEFAKRLGVHRNTIHYYLSGHGVFPQAFEKIMKALDLKPSDILIDDGISTGSSFEQIASLIDELHTEFPQVSFVLFGSRSRGEAAKYADWDIGVFSDKGLSHETYRRVVRRKNELIEDLPFFVDIVNLNRADENFLAEISKEWRFLAGRLSDWIKMQRKAAA